MKTVKGGITRRQLIQRFGAAAFVIAPVARAMGYVAGGSFAGAPRFVMFFKGGSSSITSLSRSGIGISARGSRSPRSLDGFMFPPQFRLVQ